MADTGPFGDRPGLPYRLSGHDQHLIPYVQLNDSALEGSGGVLPGEGFVPLYDYLAALPDDIDISVEAQIPPNNVYTGMEWAKISVERIRKYLARYRASAAREVPLNKPSTQAT